MIQGGFYSGIMNKNRKSRSKGLLPQQSLLQSSQEPSAAGIQEGWFPLLVSIGGNSTSIYAGAQLSLWGFGKMNVRGQRRLLRSPP